MAKKYKVVSVILSLSVFFLSTGCATILKGTSDKVSFNSDPNGAKVSLNGGYSGKTPTELKLNSNRSYQVEFQKEGYESRAFVLSNGIGVGWVLLDVLFGFVPLIVDAVTGAWYYLDSNELNANLEKK